MGIKIQQRQYELLPIGEYPAEIVSADLEDGKFGQQIKVKFALLGEGLEDRTLTGWAGASFTNKSKLYGWTKAAFGGRDIPPTWEFDSDKILGRKVLLVVVTAKGQDGGEFNKIHDIRPYRNGQAAPRAQQPANAAPAVAGEPDLWPEREPTEVDDPGDPEEDLLF